jgi:ABC-2 type transport system ATP-binding protein
MGEAMRFVLAFAAFLLLAAPAHARDATVTSFDGTQIQLSFFPSPQGGKAPTILEGHGWGGSRETNPDAASDETTGNVGVGALRKAGFNVLTWDSRGFGNSGGTVTVDSPDAEGRDVQALLDWLAKQPEAQLDQPGDPRAGMTGVSYAGGIELVTAGIDKRIDAIAPIIAWHSLLTSLYKEETVKGGWASALYAAGVPTSKGRLDPHITSAFGSGATTGTLSPEDRAWFASRGPGDLVNKITVPTFVVEGTADTLFTLDEAITNYAILKGNGVPAKMMWFCGGHGVCLTGAGPAGHIEAAVVAWLKRYVAQDSAVDTGPKFEWLADDANWRSAPDYPPAQGAPVSASGSGTLVTSPADTSGTIATAGRAVNAVNVAVSAPPVQIVGEPKLELTYSGTGTTTHVFAQLVDDKRGVVVGNQATPIPLTLDGQPHTITRNLEAIASVGAQYTLQITGGTQLYGPARGAGTIIFSKIAITLPTVGAAAVSGGAGILAPTRTCLSRRRFSIRVRGSHPRVTVAGRRVKVTRGRAIIDLRGKPRTTVKVKVVAKRHGKTVRETRTYHTCVSRQRR